jgi:molecular chaperone DnaK (HSP70)
MSATFVIGIDLGTTHTVVASAPLDGGVPVVMAIDQVVAAHEHRAVPQLPSCIYLPAAAELAPESLALPWHAQGLSFAVGSWARDRAASAPTRVVSSPKSWLCHAGVDRRAAILPMAINDAADDEVSRISPVTAQQRILEHVASAWNHHHPSAVLADQVVVLTVPASFDPVARQLTEEAAQLAGLGHAYLLEEPQAAMYAWLAGAGEQWRQQLTAGQRVLVADIGGGTSDFTLIEAHDDDGQLTLQRIAVGDHILLGGDNMDLALAVQLRQRLSDQGKTIDDWQLRALIQSCRRAKEEMLSSTADSISVVIAGRSSKLLGGSIKTELLRSDVNTLVDGFLPVVDGSAKPIARGRAGLQSFGLPYAQDAALTRHLAAFLGGRQADAVLFNGGVMKSAVLRNRLHDALNGFGAPVRALSGIDLDGAVAIGAAAFGRLRSTGKGVRIRSGTLRSFYVGIERSEMAVPGMPARVDALCVAPAGMEEGTSVSLPTRLGLLVGEPAEFRFFATPTAANRDPVIEPGHRLDVPHQGLEELAPIETTLTGDVPAGTVVPVTLQATLTDVGVLEIAAVEGNGRQHRLSFATRAAG